MRVTLCCNHTSHTCGLGLAEILFKGDKSVLAKMDETPGTGDPGERR